MISQKNLSKISNDLFTANGKKGRRIPEAVIEKDYCLSWFLIGFSKSSLKNKLVFKGGTCLRRCYFKDYRFSEDLDFTILQKISIAEILEIIRKEVAPFVANSSGIQFSIGNVEPDSLNTHQFYLNYAGPIKGGAVKSIKVDVTFSEILVTAPESRIILKSYEEYDDFEEKHEIQTYSVDEIVTEKICALLDPKRSEPRDLYDIWYLFSELNVSDDFLPGYVIDKLKNKGQDFQKWINNFAGKEARIKSLWENRLTQQMAVLPEFEGVYREVARRFKKCGISE